MTDDKHQPEDQADGAEREVLVEAGKPGGDKDGKDGKQKGAKQAPSTPPAEELLEQKQQELDALRDQMMRQVARERNEKEAAVARAGKESEQARRFAVVDMAAQLFTIADDLERAVAELRKQDNKEITIGIELIAKNLKDVFSKFSIQSIIAKAGDNFDPHYHEAVSVRSTSEHPNGTVIEVIQDGYLLDSRVLRPVRVVVAKAPDADTNSGQQKSK